MAKNEKVSVGDLVPAFELESDDQGVVSSESLKGTSYVLYFYPKDNTPGCTTQACDFRDAIDVFSDAGYPVYGVSPDSIASHEKFRAKHELNFSLLSDSERELAESLGVWREKKNYGKTYMGIVRSTFVVDADGKISHMFDNIRAKGSVDRLIKALEDNV